MEVSRPVEVTAGGVELVDTDGRVLRNSEVIAKLEEGEVVESKLDGEGWEIVGKRKAGRSSSSSSQDQASNASAARPSRPPSSAPVASSSRLPPRRAAPGKSKLSTVYNADEDWVDDMDTGSSGEFIHHHSEIHELTKIRQQNDLDTQERRTRPQRTFRAMQKWVWQEKLRRWEEHKKVIGKGWKAATRRTFFLEMTMLADEYLP
ncbi:hypothetical protein P7C70_g8064, partial [Phenoliferia sp. Uapishka_3]